MDNIPESEKTRGAPPGRMVDSTASWYLRVPPEVYAFTLFLAVTAFLTWPVLVRFGTTTYGIHGDNQGIMWHFWWFRNASSFGAGASFCPLIGFPFGSELNVIPFKPVAELLERFMLLFANEVIVYNLEIVGSFFLSGVTMYLLVRYLTRDRLPALFGGFAYTVFVYHAYHAMFFNHLAMTQWIPLFILALVHFMRKPRGLSAFLLIIAGLLVAGTDPHYGLFMSIFTAAFLAGHYAYNRRRAASARKRGMRSSTVSINRRTLALSLLVIVVVALLVLPFYYGYVQKGEPDSMWPTRPTRGSLSGLEIDRAGSARPADYVMPCKENYFFGWITRETLGGKLNSFENSLYLGWTVILLASFGVVVALRRRYKRSRTGGAEPGDPPSLRVTGEGGSLRLFSAGCSDPERAVVWGLLAAAATAFILSMPPYVQLGSFRLPLPSIVLSYAVPWLRWFMRFGVVVITCAVILSCFGLSRLLSRLRRIPAPAVLVTVLVLLLLEMTLVPPLRYFHTGDAPAVYGSISEFPGNEGIVFYPAYEPGFFNSQRYMFYQRDFRKPMLNGAPDGTDGEALRRTVYNPYNRETPGILRRFGITRVIYLGGLFEKYEGTLEREAELEFLPDGLELEEEFRDEENAFGDANVYRVTAPAAELVPLYMGDITAPHLEEGRVTVRLMESEGVIRLENYSGKTIEASVLIPVANVEHRHRVVVSAEGTALWEGTLVDGDRGAVEIESVEVPPDGLDLKIEVGGKIKETGSGEASVFGTERASLRIGDVILQLNR